MIINASGRTDIVAYYMDWFVNRWNEGYFDVRNPFNPKLVSRIFVSDVDEKLIQKLDDLDMVKLDGVIVVESLEEEVWPERIASFTKYKEKTYGITRISYYQKEENE